MIWRHSSAEPVSQNRLAVGLAKALAIVALCACAESALAVVPVGGAPTVGPQNALTLPTSAYYRCELGNQPADDSVQNLNPPIFTWLYYENPALFGSGTTRTKTFYQNASKDLRCFTLQLSTNSNMSPLLWNINSSNNFYNFLPPITNADGSTFTGTDYWSVVYCDSSGDVITNSAVHSFSLASDAVVWDRAMLADTNYLFSIVTNHPHIFFNNSNLSLVSLFLQTNNWGNACPGFGGWKTVTNDALSSIQQPWWSSQTAMTNLHSWTFYLPYHLAEAGLMYEMTANSAISNALPGATFDMYVTNFMALNYDRQEAYNMNAQIPQFIAEAYDWLYPLMTPTERSDVVSCMESMVQYWICEDYFPYLSVAPNKNRIYTNALYIPFGSSYKEGESHARLDKVGLACCLAAMGESPVLLNAFSEFMNCYLARFAAFDTYEGRWYESTADILMYKSLAPWTMAVTMFPEAQLTNTPAFRNIVNYLAFQDPVGYANPYTEPWGVRGNENVTYFSQWNWAHFYTLACLLHDGAVLRKYNRAGAFKRAIVDSPLTGDAFVPFYFPPPAENDWPTNAYLDNELGWCISESDLPTDYGSFTNGVGFMFCAKPDAGGRLDVQSYTDGWLEMWAYGASVTFTGSGNYEQHCMFGDGLFVNGIGLNSPVPAVSDPWYARFTAYTNTPDFTFVSADLTKAYARSNWWSTSYQSDETYFYSTNSLPYLSSVNRSILFPHKKYLVIYDQMQTTQPAQFEWKWNVWDPAITIDSSNCSFAYTTTNVYNGSNVAVYVAHIVDPALLTLTNMTVGQNLTGTNINNPAKINPFTGENYNFTNDPYGARTDTQFYWANTIWVYNRTPTTNWHFLSVVYPVKWGSPAPTITRIDDYTVRVQGGTDDDVISVNALNQPPIFTLNLNDSALAPPTDLHVVQP